MNYLGHAYLSFGNGEILTGNMIADHVKGRLALDKYPPGIKRGMELHRKIDAFADAHAATQRAKLWFRPDYGLYSGPITDILYDHFLANDPKIFGNEAGLLDFTQKTYALLDENEAYFPSRFAEYFPHMKQHNWLYGYRTTTGIDRSLHGLARRATHMPPVQKAYDTFIGHYYQLAQCYYEFIDEAVNYVKVELTA